MTELWLLLMLHGMPSSEAAAYRSYVHDICERNSGDAVCIELKRRLSRNTEPERRAKAPYKE